LRERNLHTFPEEKKKTKKSASSREKKSEKKGSKGKDDHIGDKGKITLSVRSSRGKKRYL